MPRTHPPYAREYRRRIVELARAGRSVAELAREFEASANAIRQWIKQAELDEQSAQRRSDHQRARGTQSAAAREPGAARRARDTFKSRGLVLSGDRCDAIAAFAFVGATWAGFLYLAVVLDALSRKIVGWAMKTYLRTQLVLKALDIARTTPRHRRDSSLGPGQPIQLASLRRMLRAGRRATVDGLGG